MRKAVLLTGAAGMLGQALCRVLESEYELIRVSKTGRSGSYACDLSNASDLEAALSAHKINFLINSAAYSDVDGCEINPQEAFNANAVAVKNISIFCSRVKIPWIHVSTDYVFDGKKGAPYLESDLTAPVNIYGMSKLAGEYFALNSQSPCAIVRTSWLFGADEPKNFVNAIMERLKNEEVISVLNDQRDAPTSVKDLSLVLREITNFLLGYSLKYPGSRWNEIFHVCNTGGATRHQMAGRIRDFMGLKNKRVELTDRAQIKNRVAIRPEYAVMSNERVQKFFNIKLRPWEESLMEFVREKCGF